MKQKDSHSPSKVYSTTKDPNTCKEENLLSNEFQNIIVKVTNKFKEETKISIRPQRGHE
jgi:hypothetical protein